jgi:hypothetical protein
VTDVSQAEIEEARQDLAQELLPDLATIERVTETSDGGGGFTEAWAPVAEDIPCRLDPYGKSTTKGGGGESGTAGERIDDRTLNVVTFGAGTDVTLKDRLVINGTTFEVTVVREHGNWELMKRVDVKEQFLDG